MSPESTPSRKIRNTKFTPAVRRWLSENPGEYTSMQIHDHLRAQGIEVPYHEARTPTNVVAGAMRSICNPTSRYHLPGTTSPKRGHYIFDPSPAARAPEGELIPESMVRVGYDDNKNPLYVDSATGDLYRVVFEKVVVS